MTKYKFKDNKGKEHTADMDDQETAELFATEMGMTLIGKVDKAS